MYAYIMYAVCEKESRVKKVDVSIVYLPHQQLNICLSSRCFREKTKTL